MKIEVVARHFSINHDLKNFITTKIEKICTQYFPSSIYAHICISKDRDIFHTIVVLDEGLRKHNKLKVDAQSINPLFSFKKAANILKHKLLSYKNSLSNKKHLLRVETQYLDISSLTDDNKEVSYQKIEEDYIPSMNIKEAIETAECAHLNTFVFINSETKKLNIIYVNEEGVIRVTKTNIQIDLNEDFDTNDIDIITNKD